MNRKLFTILGLALFLVCALAPMWRWATVQAKPVERAKATPFKASDYAKASSDRLTPAEGLQPAGRPAAKAAVDTVFFDDFEADTVGWDTIDMSFQTPKWHIDSYQAYAGNSWWCGTSTDTAGWSTPPGYGDGWAQFLISPNFDLTAISADSVIFSMWHYYNLEGPAFPDDWDCINVWADTTGDTLWHFDNWINLTPDTLRFPGTAYNISHPYSWTYTGLSPDLVPIYGWGGDNGGYTQAGFDLTRFKGKNLRLCFIGASDAAASDQTRNMNYHGIWYLDNIQVDTVSAGGARGSIFFEDGETGSGAWKATGKTPKINWHRSARRASSGTTSWYNGSEATGKYSWGQSDAMVSPLIDLRPVSNSQPCLLDFRIWPEVPDDGSDLNTYNDWWRIDVSTDSGRNWLDFAGIFIDSSKQWKNHSDIWPLNLSSYIGKIIKLRIGMGSDGDNHVGEGVYIDDFIVTGKTRDPLPSASSICLVDNDGGAADLSENSWTKYMEASLANLGYKYSVVTIGVNKTMTPGYLEQYPLVIWNLGANFDYRAGAEYKALAIKDQECILSYLNNGGRMWMAGQYYFYANGTQIDTTVHPNFWRDYLHLAPDTGWAAATTYKVTGIAGDPIGDGLADSLLYDRLNGSSVYWTDPWHAYTLNPDTPAVNVAGFMKNDDGTFNGLRYQDTTGLGYKLVYTSFPFEAVPTPVSRDTLTARVINWLKPGLNGDYTPPAVPIGLALQQNYDTVKCVWRANAEPDIKGYKVYRSLQSGIPTWSKVGSALHPDTAFADTTAESGLTYNYAITACDTLVPANESLKSLWSRIYVAPVMGLEGRPVEPFTVYSFKLEQNKPNPFKQLTTINYQLAKQGQVSLKVYSIAGQAVKTLASSVQQAGAYSVTWDGRDDKGRALSNGVYFYRLEARGQNGQERLSQTKRLIIVK